MLSFDDETRTWDTRYDHLIDLTQYKEALYGWDVDEAYLDWFLYRTHPILDPRSIVVDMPVAA